MGHTSTFDHGLLRLAPSGAISSSLCGASGPDGAIASPATSSGDAFVSHVCQSSGECTTGVNRAVS
jgi:hypothetical protein